ncbi:MAG: CDP-alcohol phosphatidyltransferase family protein [Bifidobacteriaceae bacterium]|nr:CDP-alcohol phosphatidyltransferase family protein [Bifidobacteriaceae bacterium]
MLDNIREPWKKTINPLAQFCVEKGISANTVTVIGSLGTIIFSFVAGFTRALFPCALVITFFVIFDSLDGSVAALKDGGTKFGSFLDSTLDRVADWSILTGIAVYFFYDIRESYMCVLKDAVSDFFSLLSGKSPFENSPYEMRIVWDYVGIFAAFLSIMGAFVTSYARAKGESIGLDMKKTGFCTRSDRIAICLIGMAFAGLAGSTVLAVFISVLAALTVLTAYQRIKAVYDMTDGKAKAYAKAAVKTAAVSAGNGSGNNANTANANAANSNFSSAAENYGNIAANGENGNEADIASDEAETIAIPNVNAANADSTANAENAADSSCADKTGEKSDSKSFEQTESSEQIKQE